MTLHKQSGIRVALVGGTAALFGGFFALVRSQPITAAVPAPTPPALDYDRFFQPSGATTASKGPSVSSVAPVPHTRTRAS
jgi:hypothetical protein